MSRLLLATSLCLLVLAGAPSLAADENEVSVRQLKARASAEDAESVAFSFAVGKLEVVTILGDEISLDIDVRCDDDSERCARAARNLSISQSVRRGRVKLEVDGWAKSKGHPELEAVLRVPRRLAMELDVGVGEITVEGIEQDLEVDIGVGSVDISGPRKSVRLLNLDCGVGETSLEMDGGTVEGSGFVGQSLTWRGEGGSTIEVDAGVGDISIHLN